MPATTLNLGSLSPLYLEGLFLVFTRISSAFVVAPVFGNRSFPIQVKLGLSLLLAILLLPEQLNSLQNIPGDLYPFLVVMAKEILLGLVIGFAYMLVVLGIQMGAHLMGLQIGLGMANIIDPVSSNQVSVLDSFYTLFALLVFLTLNGHHWIILALQKTFELAPLGSFSLTEMFTYKLVSMTGNVIITAVKLSLPVMITLLLTDVAMGLIARMVPQLNILIVGMPLKIVLGLIILMLSIPSSVIIVSNLFNGVGADVQSLILAMK